MRIIKTMKIGTLLVAGFSGVIIIGLLVAILGRSQLVSLGNNMETLSSDSLANLLLIQDVKSSFDSVARTVRNIALQPDRQKRLEEKQLVDERIAHNTAVLATLDKNLSTPAARQSMEQLNQARPAYIQAVNEALALGLSDDPAEHARAGDTILNRMVPTQKPVFTALDSMVEVQKTQALATTQGAIAQADRGGNLILALAIVAALVGALVSFLVTRTLRQQLGGELAYATHIAQQVAQGNLAVEITLRANDDRSMLASMNEMRNSLSDMVDQVRQSSEAIATGSSQIAAGSADLSQRTEEQAASLQQTAAAMEQISQTVRQNGETVRNATQLANQASSTAAQGGEAVNHIVSTMKDIAASSSKIGDIIGVIDGIAFQTNILALNAAVEAARAGEQGRGFAVVAGEVRSLAQRSASAAKEIKTLINDSVEKVDSGSQQVEHAGATIEASVRQAHNVANLIAEIGVTTQEQESGIAQIHDAISQLDQVTQQNAALVEESASAADSLNEQSANLVDLMRVFRLRADNQVPRQSLPPEAPIKTRVTPTPRLTQGAQWERF
ncbi:MCP four helix bundle domain-containing protein [Candidatus Symbiopectobacterium sp. NZEC127]|uniref:methyl-accepting chemotaxis protein n=1 Tax=Candidatus Symbiopectobacterium sp. NZEC127 TaxID=2820472 RepID=UPI002225D01C|nr:methyl-accepting chemotaxis protein [Candidatus Symbiopectobacterium sp. NZEC127]MCW2487764.1 MCP four helix bundle domain-containing protein [Candidatus Symbiopectobacterium sp. NZEC127]